MTDQHATAFDPGPCHVQGGSVVDAFYKRENVGQGAEFTVTPAPWPGVGCLGMPAMIGIGLVLFFSISNPLLLITAPMLAIIGWISWRAIKTGRKENAKRVPKTIAVDPTEIRVDGQHYAASDIAEVGWRDPTSGGPDSEFVYSDRSSTAAAQSYGRNLGHKLNHVSNSVTLRLTSDSRPVSIMDGLTPDVARTLARDIGAIIGR